VSKTWVGCAPQPHATVQIHLSLHHNVSLWHALNAPAASTPRPQDNEDFNAVSVSGAMSPGLLTAIKVRQCRPRDASVRAAAGRSEAAALAAGRARPTVLRAPTAPCTLRAVTRRPVDRCAAGGEPALLLAFHGYLAVSDDPVWRHDAKDLVFCLRVNGPPMTLTQPPKRRCAGPTCCIACAQVVSWDIWEFFASDWASAEAKRIHNSAGAAARAAEAARRFVLGSVAEQCLRAQAD